MTNKDKDLEIIDRLKLNGYVNNRERGVLRRALLEERPTGHWIEKGANHFFCSECDRKGNRLQHYCGWCGADMRRKTNSAK